MESPLFSLSQFTGPLDLLIHLVQKEEIDILEISLREIIAQFAGSPLEQIDVQAELLPLTASLMLLKSERLIPGEKKEQQQIQDRMQLIETVITYCRLKEAANLLKERGASQMLLFPRAAAPPSKPTALLEGLSLEVLTQKLTEIMQHAALKKPLSVEDEQWQVSVQIAWLKEIFQKKTHLPFDELFESLRCKAEMIVTFLALLEIMKIGIIGAFYEEGVLWLKSIS